MPVRVHQRFIKMEDLPSVVYHNGYLRNAVSHGITPRRFNIYNSVQHRSKKELSEVIERLCGKKEDFVVPALEIL
jgi:hypothetical protein